MQGGPLLVVEVVANWDGAFNDNERPKGLLCDRGGFRVSSSADKLCAAYSLRNSFAAVAGLTSMNDKIHLDPVARFLAAIQRLRSDVAAGREPEPALAAASELAQDIRAMSPDEAWKMPCNRFREAILSLRIGEIAPIDVVRTGERLVDDLPATAKLEPLDYWPARDPAAKPD